jgi:hypothetical protein
MYYCLKAEIILALQYSNFKTAVFWVQRHVDQTEPNSAFPTASACFLLGLFFDHIDGSDDVLSKYQATSELHDTTTEKTVLFIITAIRTSNPSQYNLVVTKLGNESYSRGEL